MGAVGRGSGRWQLAPVSGDGCTEGEIWWLNNEMSPDICRGESTRRAGSVGGARSV